MTGKQFHEALNHLDPSLVEKYYALKDRYLARNRVSKRSLYVKMGVMAACVCLVFGCLWVYSYSQPKKGEDPSLTATEAVSTTGNNDPQADLTKPFEECWHGTITGIEIDRSGSDPVCVIELSVKDHAPIRFTSVEDTRFLKLNTATGMLDEIVPDDLYVDAWVEIECKSSHNSDYHAIITVTVIE